MQRILYPFTVPLVQFFIPNRPSNSNRLKLIRTATYLVRLRETWISTSQLTLHYVPLTVAEHFCQVTTCNTSRMKFKLLINNSNSERSCISTYPTFGVFRICIRDAGVNRTAITIPKEKVTVIISCNHYHEHLLASSGFGTATTEVEKRTQGRGVHSSRECA